MSPISIEKQKLPKGVSYALKTSHLVDALEKAGRHESVQVTYSQTRPRDGWDLILESLYWQANANVPYVRFCIRAGTVAPAERKKAEILLREQVIPALILWMHTIQSLPEGSTRLKHNLHFGAYYSDGNVSLFGETV